MELAEARSEHILIVEDEGLIAADVQRKLQRLGYPLPAIAKSGEHALRRARATPFDLVLMDICLKGNMDGIVTAQALKVESRTPVVYMTAHSDEETIGRAKLTEPLGYIVKPITDDKLRSGVQIALYRHLMEERVRTSEAWLSTTLRSVGDGIIATDTTGEIVFMNPVAEKLCGWSHGAASGHQLMDVLALFEEATGQPASNPISNLLAEETRTYHLIPRNGAMTAVEVACFENRIPGDLDATVRVAATADTADPADGLIGAIVVFRDITARRQMEGSMVQLQRMEAVANMAGSLAHDFNNQFSVILEYANELCTLAKGNEKEKEAAMEIQQAASIAASITAQLLMLSRRGASQLDVLNVNEIVCEVQPVISHSLGKDRALLTDLSSAASFVRGDRNHLKQALLNLALNARDAMPKGGELRIETSMVEITAESHEARMYRPERYVRLRMVDSGEGMDKSTLARIFEPFFTTKKVGLGSGLGLSIAHSIIATSGGYIRAESEIGLGTIFEILLPCVDTFRRISEISGSEQVGEDPIVTVLLMDEEPAVRRLMHIELEREGYQLLEARNAEEAELIAEVYAEPIHVLVSDVMMPGLTGPDLASRLRALRPDMKTLLVSGYQHDTLERHGFLRGEMNLLPKPFAAADLIQRVQMLLSHDVLRTK